mgnify:CR=1 FL=1
MTPLSRRQLLARSACGFGSLALTGLCHENRGHASTGSVPFDAAAPLSPRAGHHPATAKRVIFVFMQGGPSQVDSYDYKPALARHDGQKVDFDVARTRKITPERVFQSPWSFRQYGECGQWVSELFPHMARHVDDYCVVRSMHTEGVAHGPATLFLHTGATNLIRPSVGAWISYGLGTENQSLPGFVTISPPPTKGGPRNYSNAFLPSVFQGTTIGRGGTPIPKARIPNLRNNQISGALQRQQFELLRRLNRAQLDNATVKQARDLELEAVINSYELAYRMQSTAPAVMDLNTETRATQKMYGIGEEHTDDFGRQCLLARRFAEAGARFIQVSYSDTKNTPKWDQHSNLPEHAVHARNTDKPVAGLLADLKQRGLLEDTLVWWGGEFGRTPFAQGRNGRDHNPRGFTVWLAGGGIRGGQAWGETDEFGYQAVEKPVHMHDLHATILHALGINHTRLTYPFAGRDFRLTDVHGEVVHGLFA